MMSQLSSPMQDLSNTSIS